MSDPRAIVTSIWKWLPVFRAVAETESATQAARSLGVTPPAVSKALGQVESALGRELFDRKGRQLLLNPNGHALLAVVLEVESRLHHEVARLMDGNVAGSVRLGAVGQLGSHFLLPAAVELGRQYPQLEVSIVHAEPQDAMLQLEARRMDLYLALNVAVGEPLAVQSLTKLEMAVYAGKGHPVFDSSEGIEGIEGHSFVAQRRPTFMKSVWPRGLSRTISIVTDVHSIALQACLGGSHLMVMERLIASRFVAEGRLREIRADFLEAAELVLIRHAHSLNDPLINRVAGSIEKTVNSLDEEFKLRM